MTSHCRRYVIWENLLYILSEYDAQSPVYLGYIGHTHITRGYMSGGAGYVISWPAVRKIVDEGVNFPSDCPTDGAIEDVDVGRYLWRAEHERPHAWARGEGRLRTPGKCKGHRVAVASVTTFWCAQKESDILIS